MNGYDLENQSCGRARSSCRRSTTGFTGTATTAASVLDTCCNGANSRNHQRFRRKRVELQANRVARSMQLRWSRPRGRDGRLGDSRRFESITCIILNRQLSRKLLDSSLSAAESQEFVGRQRIFLLPPSVGGVYYVTVYAVGLADPAIVAGAMDWCRYCWLRSLVVPDLEYLAGFGWPFLIPDGK